MDSQKAKSIFLHAIEHIAPDEWPDYLSVACGDNPSLRHDVEILLAAHQDGGDLAAQGRQACAEALPTVQQPLAEEPGTQIGLFKLLQKLGEGGMGVVYMAEQSEPVERRVALKIIKPGMDTRQVIARFEAERQALAVMDHPNIAKVLDAGTTESGRPYFVMELVKGIPVTRYCDEQRLNTRERLELFIPICQAVQHAHQKGIIHRDLKPSNILIARYDDRPVPKIIDFGVAKAISRRLTEKTMFTQYGQIVGTLEYMSPEQASFNQLDIDTRSDIYSLGVLLYELLTGETPFDKQRLRSAAYDEILRIIREEDPPRPSTRLSSSSTLPSIAANRNIDPNKLSGLLRNELDWVVMKALEKDRGRRYETATGLAGDLALYLDSQPVSACPPSTYYRFRKFVGRNRGLLTTLSLIGAVMVIGTAVSTWQAIRATRAATAEHQALEKATAAQQQEAIQRSAAEEARAKAVVALEQAKTEHQRAEEALRQVTEEQKRSEENLTLSLEALDAVYLDAIGTEKMLGPVRKDQGESSPLTDLEKELIRRGLSFYDQFAEKNADAPRAALQTARAYYRVGVLDAALGEVDEAKSAYGAAIKRFQRLSTADPTNIALKRELAEAHFGLTLGSNWQPRVQKEYDQALEAFAELIALNPNDHLAWYRSAKLHTRLNDYHSAQNEYERAIQLAPKNAFYRNSYADFLRFTQVREISNWGLALLHLKEVALLEPESAVSHARLGRLLADTGDSQAALQAFDKALALDPLNSTVYDLRSIVLRNLGKYDESLHDAEKALELDPQRGMHHRRRAEALQALKRYDEALESYAIAESKAPENPWIFASRGDLYLKRKQYDLALKEYDKTLQLKPDWWYVRKRRAAVLFSLGRYQVSLSDLQTAFNQRPTDLSTLLCLGLENIAACPDENLKLGLIDLANEAVEHPDTDKVLARHCRGRLLAALGRKGEAIRDYLWRYSQTHLDSSTAPTGDDLTSLAKRGSWHALHLLFRTSDS